MRADVGHALGCLLAVMTATLLACGADKPAAKQPTDTLSVDGAQLDAGAVVDGGPGVDTAHGDIAADAGGDADADVPCEPSACPSDGNPCTAAVCGADGACQHAPFASGSGCDDGDPCTLTDTCQQGACVGKGAPNCDDGDPCTVGACVAVAGEKSCSTTPAADGSACDDGSVCTQGDACEAGTCKAGASICPCVTNADCAKEDDGDLCNGTLYCDKSQAAPNWTCKVNPATVVKCGAATAVCTSMACDPKTGSCKTAPLLDGTPCDDGSACTVGDVCKAGGCVAGEDTCCADNADCLKYAKGDLCKGLWFCNQASKQCQLNPATQKVCPTTGDTACVKNTCITVQSGPSAALAAACTPVAVSDGTSCDDGDACTGGDVCKGGSCAAATAICACKADKDCAAYGDKCSGTFYCDKTLKDHACRLNPATKVVCATVGNSACKVNTCAPATGQCGFVPLPDQTTCDADGSACTPGDVCAGGKCVVGTSICDCSSDKDCAGAEDGDLCNGTLFCDKSGGKATCKLNPATVVSCPTVNDTTCKASRCEPKTGLCALTAISEFASCSDGLPCTTNDRCKGGSCAPGPDVCKCHNDAECAAFDDKNACTGTLYCDKAALPWHCKTNVGSIPSCDKSGDTACAHNTCSPKDGTCAVLAVHEGLACQDLNKCTAGDVCKQGKCVGLPLAATACDDANPCTEDGCEAVAGCTQVTATDGVACDDGQGCTVASGCVGGACGGGKPKSCDDKNGCTQDSCAAATGICLHKSGVVNCDDGQVCTTDACVPATGLCAHTPKAGSCAADGLCASGTCSKGHCIPALMHVRNLAGTGYGGSASGYQMDGPQDVVMDSAGTLYITAYYGRRVHKKTATGPLLTLAGNGSEGTADGKGSSARFTRPEGIAFDLDGTLVVADGYGHRLRRVTKSGVVTTIAGGGSTGYSAGGYVDGPVSKARFNRPKTVAIDAKGVYFIADAENNRIRKLVPEGIVSTLAGSGKAGLIDGPANTAAFDYPEGIAVDSKGVVYVADTDNHAIRKVTPAGVVTTIVGNGAGYVDGLSAKARFRYPNGIALGPGGRLWVADTDNHRIRRVEADGFVTTVAGGPVAGDMAGDADQALLHEPHGLFWTSDHRLLAAVEYSHRVVELYVAGGPSCDDKKPCTLDACSIKTGACTHHFRRGICHDGDTCIWSRCSAGVCKEDGPTVHTLAGAGSEGDEDGTARLARFDDPSGVAIGPDGEVYVADLDNHLIRKISPAGVVSTLAGMGDDGMINGAGAKARFDRPYDLVMGKDNGVGTDKADVLYVADFGNNRIRRVRLNGVVETYSGTGSTLSTNGGFVDGLASKARFDRPSGVGYATNGDVLVADTYNHRIRRITYVVKKVSTVAGGASGYVNGPGSTARFRYPRGVAVASDGVIWVADTENHAIRKIATNGQVSTVAGVGGKHGWGGSGVAGAKALFYEPWRIAIESDGGLIVADTYNDRVRRITTAGVVYSLAGVSLAGFADDTAAFAKFYDPTGVAVDSRGHIYIADRNNHRIRIIQPTKDGCRQGTTCKATMCVAP